MTDESTKQTTQDELAGYEIRYQEPDWRGELREKTRQRRCDTVVIEDGIARFQLDGEDRFALNTDHLISYERMSEQEFRDLAAAWNHVLGAGEEDKADV